MTFYLLDTNFFRAAIKSPEGEIFTNFTEDRQAHPKLKQENFVGVRTTPFLLLEAIGVVPPRSPELVIPEDLLSRQDSNEIYLHLMATARDYYSSHPDLSYCRLEAKLNEQREYVDCGLLRSIRPLYRKPISRDAKRSRRHFFILS